MRVHFLKTGASKRSKGEFKGGLAKRLEHESWDLGLGPALKLQMDQREPEQNALLLKCRAAG